MQPQPDETRTHTWRPVDVMGMRLYRVMLQFSDHKEHRVVFGTSPHHAASLVERHYRDIKATECPSCTGHWLNVLQPKEWHEQRPLVSAVQCKHDHRSLVQRVGMYGQNAGEHVDETEEVFLCPDCGEFEVRVSKLVGAERVKHSVRFGLTSDVDVAWAARYLRSEVEAEEVLERLKAKG